MNFLKKYIHFFVSTTTAVVFITGLDAATGDYDVIPKYTLLLILAASALTSLASVLVFSYAAKTRKQYVLQSLLLYVILCIIMVSMGLMVGWVERNLFDAFLMCVYVALVYAIVTFFSYLLLKQEADEFNKAINRRRNKKN